MIGRLKGLLISKQPPWLLVDVNGVGYDVEAPMSSIYDLPATGQEVCLLIHTVVREDAFLLYGFLREGERSLFRNLLKISGVGAKLALAILSGMSAQEFAEAVQRNDVSTLIRLPGIGRKTAERLIIEMRDRLGGLEGASLPGTTTVVGQGAMIEAITALESLGYKPIEATRMARAVPDAAGLEAGEIIRAALKQAVK
ncbi:MAG: Holliday junction branch migration protein RuvA [Halothiobacillus sp. 24-54-40]|jgi:Holliday junction DNA helicase RuvA|nr:MAG: Holliday junction branch migration protein RuvA [Halothiobacillus sp. 24-54-40]OZA80107.1 MAG: Holliday junction branch migration protein RuvA [Halothiobacillus sp. 39-53-45]HQS03797.1 Holliday junction branch migration protein RuvA [Halothiobacillus sp.]HQS30055.1 Holliday junction branch migration protein RuvA [Halothiobacillus sp.]